MHIFLRSAPLILLLVVALSGSASVLRAQVPIAPLESILDADGTIRAGAGGGSFAVDGWRMSLGPDGTPRFSREERGNASAQWSYEIGTPGVDHVVIHAMLLDGEMLYVGGNMDFTVRALAFYQGRILAAGDFRRAGLDGPSGIATWNGVGWLKVGDGIDGSINAVEVVGDMIYAGGSFSAAGDIPASNLARWDGTRWSEFGGGVDGVVDALEYANDILYVGGDISRVGTLATRNIARYREGAWENLGRGTSSRVYALAWAHEKLYAASTRRATASTGSTVTNGCCSAMASTGMCRRFSPATTRSSRVARSRLREEPRSTALPFWSAPSGSMSVAERTGSSSTWPI